MKIGLLTTLNTNIGDDFIRHGILGFIHALLQNDFQTESVNKHRPRTVYPTWHPSRYLIGAYFKLPTTSSKLAHSIYKSILPLGGSRFSECKIIFQCGTPILWEGCSNSEWAEFIWQDIFSRLGSGQILLNIGGGSCYPWERQPETLIGSLDEAFARMMHRCARLTTVRDPLCQNLFRSVGADVELIPCPALLAAQTCVDIPSTLDNRVLINFMSHGAHSTWDQKIDPTDWKRTMNSIVSFLKRDWEPVFICHNQRELLLAQSLWPEQRVFLPKSVQQYFEFARGAFAAIVNRLHAAVSLAGIGIPSIAIGTDTRLLMTSELKILSLYIKNANIDTILENFQTLINNRSAESRRLLSLRHTTFQRYLSTLQPYIYPLCGKED
jgi:hypothetical protein